MFKRTKLLATVALPIVSLVWQPVEAAVMRPVLPTAAMPHFTEVQSQEELLLPKRRNRDDNRNNDDQPRKRSREDEGGGKNNREAKEQLDRARQERRERKADEGRRQEEQQQERRQKQRDTQREQRQDENQQRNREERRQKQRDAERQQEDKQKTRDERRQKQRDAERQQKQQDENQQKAREERRQKQRDAERDQQRQDEKAREERRQKQRDAERDQKRQDENQQKAREERRQKQRDAETGQQQRDDRKARERDAERERKRPDEAGGRPRRDQERERIARDPSRTTDTIELPFVGGAAVLDSDKDWDNRRDRSREDVRRERERERRDVRVRVPDSDRDAQVGWKDRDRIRYESVERERGERRDRRPRYQDRDGWRVEREVDDRFVINFGNRIIVRSDDGRRLSRRATETYYEDLPHGRVREVIVRPNGDRVVTIRNRFGDVIQRSRVDEGGREYVMFYAPEIDRDERPTFVDPGERLPPMRLTIPVDEYIVDTSAEAGVDYRDFLQRPPVEPVERVYTLDEVKYSARIRDKVRRIDLDTITFATGSADVSMSQASTLRKVAEAMNGILDKDAGETFLIEGHTDAVGSDESNLVLSDERAEAVANILTDVYDIPPENLATQGYGERFLKIDTDGPEQLNRRVTIRRVTPLVKPVAMAE